MSRMLNIKDDILVNSLIDQMDIREVLNYQGLTELAINQEGKLWFERGNGWEFKENNHVTYDNCFKLANSLCVFSNLNYEIGYKNPIASVVLPDGERGQIIAPPACERKTVAFGIRKPSIERFSFESDSTTGRLINAKKAKKRTVELTDLQRDLLTLYEHDNSYDFLVKAIQNKLNILLVGETGSGKTTIMKSMVDLYPTNSRIFTIEDVPEVDLPLHLNHLHLFYKEHGVTASQIIKACMRLKPDHIFLAELRGDEALQYMEALNTGHTGSITTIHANDCVSAFSRLTDLIKNSKVGITMDYHEIYKKVMTTIDVVCFFERTYLKEIYFDPLEKNKIEAMGLKA